MENNKILKYLEGQLSDQDKKDFEALIESNSDLQLEVEMLGNLIDNVPAEIPPYELRQKIYQMANIKNETLIKMINARMENFLQYKLKIGFEVSKIVNSIKM